jgi:hypothetical protein
MLAAGLMVLLACLQAAGAQVLSVAPVAGRVEVIGSTTYWRMYHALGPPVVDIDGQAMPYLRGNAWLDGQTPLPPVAWKETGFDDSGWLRTPARGGCQTPYLYRHCLRGKFMVADPAKVQDLRLTLTYQGGAAVYLNGKELARGHLPRGELTENTLATSYPMEAFVAPSGDLLAEEGTYVAPGKFAGKPDAPSAQRIAERVRRVEALAIPSAALRQGVNVLAIEIFRAPYHGVVLETKQQAGGKNRYNRFDWNTCGLGDVRLSAARGDGLMLHAGRPAGFQVWNSDPLAADGSLDYGDPCEPLGPIRLVAARNGVFSGKVVVGSSKPISDLKAVAGELKGPGSVIPAAAVCVRCGLRWGAEAGFCEDEGRGAIRRPYTQRPAFFGALVDAPPAEVPVDGTTGDRLAGAVVPVWVTVKVPRDAKAGLYSGPCVIQAKDERPVSIDIQLEVADYTLPDPHERRTWVELIEVPDTLAVEYALPLWSEAHWRMIDKSFQLISDCGPRSLYVPAVAHTNLGNSESMIRWIRKGDDRYEWDFSIMDRYLDIAEKHIGRPQVVVLQVWEIYMSTRSSVGKRFGPEWDQRQQASGGGALVTVLDPASGKTANAPLVDLMDPASKIIWRDLIGQVRQRLSKRGLETALMLGMFTDAMPPKEHMQFFQDIAPDLPWVHQGHGRWKQKVYGIAEVGYQASVWGGFRFADGMMQTNQQKPATVTSLYGWKEPRLDAVFERNLDLDVYPATRWRFFAETAITGELRGVGRIGADYWKAVKDRSGRRVGQVHARFPEGAWGGGGINLNLCNSVLAPGPAGPIATNRLTALAEGIQECEARITIEHALTDERLRARLGPELARRCQELLDSRLHDMWRALCNYQIGGPFFFGAGAWRWTPGVPGHRWYLSHDWQDESRKLFELAGQVQRATR